MNLFFYVFVMLVGLWNRREVNAIPRQSFCIKSIIILFKLLIFSLTSVWISKNGRKILIIHHPLTVLTQVKNIYFLWSIYLREMKYRLDRLHKNVYFLKKWKLFSCVRLFATPWTIQSVEFSRTVYWSG